MSFHRDLRGDDLHPTKIELIEESPLTSRTPEYIGETVIDTTAKALYTASGLTSDDWELIGSAGEGLSVSLAVDVDITGRQDEYILEWDSTTDKYTHIPDMQGKNAGLVTPGVTVTDNEDGSITLGNASVVLYPGSDNAGKPTIYNVIGTSFTLTNNTTNYIVVNYNSGTPIFQNITNVDLITESNIVPVRTIYRNETDLYGIGWSSLADGLPNKLHMRIVKTDRFGWESGVTLSESAGRIVNTTSGRIWYGAVRTSILSHTSATDEWSFWYHLAGVWTENKTTTTYNNTQYDNGTNLIVAQNNKYLVNWIYRCSCNPARGSYVLGNQQYDTIADAKSSQPPELPSVLNSVHFLVGRIIVLRGATSGIVESSFGKQFTSSPVTTHNNLTGLNDGDYVHLTAAEYVKLFTLDGSPIKPVAKYHRNAILETTAADTWIDIPWDTDIASETTTGFSRNGAIITYSGPAGILNVSGAVRPSWTGSDNSTETVIIYIRLLQSLDDGDNWTESRCIQTIGVRQQRSGVVSTSRFGGTIGAITGELIKIQYRVTNIDLDLAGSAVFDNTVAATVFLEYSTRK